MSVPYVVICGLSGSGKTTLIEGLLRELRSCGISVGVIKHTSKDVEFDRRGKDSWRFGEAGASSVALVTPGGYAIYRRHAPGASLEQVLRHFEGVDLVLVEGFKAAQATKIEVTADPSLTGLFCGVDPNLIAVAAPGAVDRASACGPTSAPPGAAPCPVFDRDDHAGIAMFIVRKILEERTRT